MLSWVIRVVGEFVNGLKVGFRKGLVKVGVDVWRFMWG